MLSEPALALAVVLMLPLMLAITVIDVKHLRIPNWAVLAVFGAFLATGSWGLPVETFLWRLGYAAIVLVIGFGLYSVAQGYVGAGDLKLIAALAPFLSGANLVDFLLIYIAASVSGLGLFLAARAAIGRRKVGWKALEQGLYFPAGVLLGLSMAVSLLAEAAARFGWLA
jgi:prepilin peptidase CpaA